MRRRAANEPSLFSVETARTAPPQYETSSIYNANTPVPPQYRNTALSLELPQPSVLASSSSQNETSRAPPLKHVGRPKYQLREFNVRRPLSSRPSTVYREQLSSPIHGCALWDPEPAGIYDKVSIGDVGFVREGYFFRMFNVTLQWDDPLNKRLGQPDYYKPLEWGQFANVHKTSLEKGDYSTPNVSSQSNADNPLARDPRE